MLKARNATALIPTSRTTSATGSYSSQCLLCTLMLHLAEKNPATDATRDGVLVLGPLPPRLDSPGDVASGLIWEALRGRWAVRLGRQRDLINVRFAPKVTEVLRCRDCSAAKPRAYSITSAGWREQDG